MKNNIKLFLLISCMFFSQTLFSQTTMIKANNCDCLYNTGGTFTWSGSCVNGYCDGYGCIQWYDNYGNKGGLFCGNVKNGKNEGLGRQYDKYGKLIFEGMFVNDLENGFGTSYNNGKIVYEGKYINGQRSFGSEYLSDGSDIYYIGEFADGKMNGKGVFYRNYKQGKIWYKGQVKDGLFNGFGTSYFDSGNVEYEGEWYLDNKHGKGVLYNEEGNVVFKGNWNHGYQYGENLADNQSKESSYKTTTESPTTGCISGDCQDGSGTVITKDGKKFIGQFKSVKVEGYGTLYDTNGSVICQGNWENGTFVNQNSSSNSSSALAGAIIAGAAIYEVGKLIFGGASSSSSSSSSSGSSSSTNSNKKQIISYEIEDVTEYGAKLRLKFSDGYDDTEKIEFKKSSNGTAIEIYIEYMVFNYYDNGDLTQGIYDRDKLGTANSFYEALNKSCNFWTKTKNNLY